MNESIGALWENGDYMTGEITINGQKIKIVVFPNDYKKHDKQPDFRIFISKPKEEKVEDEYPF